MTFNYDLCMRRDNGKAELGDGTPVTVYCTIRSYMKHDTLLLCVAKYPGHDEVIMRALDGTWLHSPPSARLVNLRRSYIKAPAKAAMDTQPSDGLSVDIGTAVKARLAELNELIARAREEERQLQVQAELIDHHADRHRSRW